MQERRKEPKGFKWGTFKNDDDASIRYGSFSPNDESSIKGTMVFLPGFRETAEKYFETIQDFTDRGYNVWIMDWRGQGGSDRYIANYPQKAHSEGFDALIRDLHYFTQNIVKTNPEKPFIANAHSMGAHLTLRYCHEHDGVFDGAILNAPMLDINTGKIPKYISKILASWTVKAGKGTQYIPHGKDWGETSFKENRYTTSPMRFNLEQEFLKNNPHLQVGDATFGWVNAAYKSMGILHNDHMLKSIKAPILMATPEYDEVVGVKAQHRAAKLIPNCKQISIPGIKHELWMEGDDVRQSFLKHCDRFLKTIEQKKKLKNNFSKSVQKRPNRNFGI